MARLGVEIVSADPVLESGVRRLMFCSEHEFDLVDTARTVTDVAVVVTDTIDGECVRMVRDLRARDPQSRVLLVSGATDPPKLLDAVNAGAGGFLWRREASAERLAAAITAVAHAEGTIPADLLDEVLGYVSRPGGQGVGGASRFHEPTFNIRERTVLAMLAEGRRTEEIADALAYSAQTVAGIIHMLIGRLQARNRAHAVAHALKLGLI